MSGGPWQKEAHHSQWSKHCILANIIKTWAVNKGMHSLVLEGKQLTKEERDGLQERGDEGAVPGEIRKGTLTSASRIQGSSRWNHGDAIEEKGKP